MQFQPCAPMPGCGVGKVALVTGANTGIGLATARGLGELGFDVLVGSRSIEKGDAAVAALRSEGIAASLVRLDLEDHVSIQQAARLVEERHSALDVLVNNAGIKEEFFPSSATPSSASLEILSRTLMTNVVGSVAVTQAMLPLLQKASAARIVTLSSGLGSLTWVSDPETVYRNVTLLGYNSSKAALNMAMVLFATELAETPIKINLADPGPVATPMNPRATRTTEESILPVLWLATLDSSGPTGGYFDANGSVPW